MFIYWKILYRHVCSQSVICFRSTQIGVRQFDSRSFADSSDGFLWLHCRLFNGSMANAVNRRSPRCSTCRSQDSWPNADWSDHVADSYSTDCNFAFRCPRYCSNPTELIVMYCSIYSIAYFLCHSASVVDWTIDFSNVDQIQISESIGGGELWSGDKIDWICNGTQSPRWEEA